MSLPKHPDGSLDWKRIKTQKPEFWDYEVMQQSTGFSDDGLEPQLLLENVSDFGRYVHSSAVSQLRSMFDDIKYKHHPDGFDDFDEEF